MNEPVKVLLVDDDEFLLNQLAESLSAHDDILITACATSGSQAICLLNAGEHFDTDVVMIDVEMPGMDGPATASAILMEHPELIIVMYTVFAQRDSLDRSIKAGARGFVTKDTPSNEIVAMIRRVVEGQVVMSAEPTAIVTQAFREQVIRREEDREFEKAVDALPESLREIFNLLTLTLSNREIEEKTRLKQSTIRSYINDVLHRTGCRSRSHLVLRAARTGLTYHSENVKGCPYEPSSRPFCS